MPQIVLTLLISVLCFGMVQAEIVTRTVEYKQGDTPLEGYLAYDDAQTGKRPGILVVHQWMGLTDYEKGRCQMLAKLGYVAFAADIYGKGVRPKTMQEAAAQAGKYKGDRALYRARLKAGLDQLKSEPQVDTSKLAAIGYCFGGTGALELARSGADIAGIVSFHGGLDNPNPEDAKNIRCAVLVLTGGNDPNVPPEQVAAFMKEMQPTKVQWDLHAYGGAVHAFTQKGAGNDPSRGAAYNARADHDSWAAMQRFFDGIFGKSKMVMGDNDPPGSASATEAAAVPDSPEKTHPLGVGAQVPDVEVRDIDGHTVRLLDRIAAEPTVLIFYRGGWCPYCNAHLAKLKEIEPKLMKMGIQILAVGADRPEKMKETLDKHDLNYTLLSDAPMAAARAFGLAFKVDDATLEKYKGYGIDLEAASGYKHHELPVPAAYVVNRKGKILYAYSNPNYKVRIEPDTLLAAAEKALK